MKISILNMLIAIVWVFGATACGDNAEETFEPLEVNRTLDVKPEWSDYSNGQLVLGAGPTKVTVEVESNTRWLAEVTACEGGWCSVEDASGSANGSFVISVRDNMTEERSCAVLVYRAYIKDGVWEKETEDVKTITVNQKFSKVRITPGSVEEFDADNPRSVEFTISAQDVDWTLSVEYENSDATDFVSILPINNMEVDGSGFKGSGDASFNVTLQPNRTQAARTAYVTLKSTNVGSTNGSYSVQLIQKKSDHAFEVTPVQPETIAAAGDSINFNLYSPNSSWKVNSAADWIKFEPYEGVASDNRVTVKAVIAPNVSGSKRSAEVRFQPDVTNVPGMSVTIVQDKFGTVFEAHREGSAGILIADEQTMEFTLKSDFNWEMSLPSWITTSVTSGGPINGQTTITLSIAENTTGADRSGWIKFTPLLTEVAPGVKLDPAVLNDVETQQFLITQSSGKSTVSGIWLTSGYDDSQVVVEFDYLSPVEVTEAGVQWRRAETDDEWKSLPGEVVSTTSNNVTVRATLKDLSPSTRYVARGYVKFGDGQEKNGVESQPFTTADKNYGKDSSKE